MKALFFTVTVTSAIFTFLGSPSMANEGRYFRVWQGFKKPDLSQKQFLKELPSFMKDTMDLYDRRGLNNYMVVIPPQNKPEYIPDELALVALTSEDAYRKVRDTPEGKEYGRRHWDIFNRENSSSSKHFVDFQEERPSELKNNWTYDMVGHSIDWSQGYSAIYIGTRKKTLSPREFLDRLHGHAKLVVETLKPMGMQAYLVLANENYEVAYIQWPSKEAHDQAFAQERAKVVFEDASTMLDMVMYQQIVPFAAGQTVQAGSAYSTVLDGDPVR